ncbi:hypothetical protein [Pseudogemmobacter bohemicus]|uniref:hypothetical protein n=1 Tax=Pseudogemmobacter bohemicus TaxID=2250708 RepID=UPI000DD2EA1C|nr:hypothetical protein [Pseudogemmobacter bohemicus]
MGYLLKLVIWGHVCRWGEPEHRIETRVDGFLTSVTYVCQCKGCGRFERIEVPLPLDRSARLSMRAKCPTCGGKRIAVANLQND